MTGTTGVSSEHLDDERFAELWTNAAAEGQPVSHPHLQGCAECRLRFASFTSWLEDLRVDAIAEAEAAMPADRLAAQRSQILRRIEAGERPARVIAFPKQPVEARTAIPAPRWMMGVAAACFIAGLGLGQMLDLGQRYLAPAVQPPQLVSNPGVVPAVAVMNPATPATPATNDEADLEELEAASTPRYEALRAYDNFTPRAADFLQSAR
jgi:hypothetical protein